MDTLRGWARLKWSCEKEGGDGQFIILILQTFPVTSESTFKGPVLLASLLMTT